MQHLEESSCGICSGVGSFKVRRADGWVSEPCPCARDNQEQAILKQLAKDKARLQELEMETNAIRSRLSTNIDLLSKVKARH